ncbi:DUF1064 domain-containing protein [Aureimonas fodinaquatilis]|uniref:DUF1064 domain-containing protein n=1 Tax=Aureimonas fodinaquatilis TaxID=2565783 RepID=A0A5B0DV38_9HYPH|nr:DUF1064 domain-containing protein [Aureimonas fodinaquatilis]KAA0970293.1 DUF1064 domain-containing protein [Aureimonas fodinaquatilis]
MTSIISETDFRAMTGKPRRSKYGNVRVEHNGIKFDSKAEYNYFLKLERREEKGEVSNIRHQVPFVLKGENGQIVAVYNADFVFYDSVTGRERVVDVKGNKGGKGTITPVFRLKAKLMQDNHGITVEVVS